MTMSYLSNTNYLQNDMDRRNAKYRRKYRSLKQRAIGLVIENAALCDEVAKVQETIVILKEERRFLLRKLLEYENDADPSAHTKSMSPSVHTNGPQTKRKKRSDDHGSFSAVG